MMPVLLPCMQDLSKHLHHHELQLLQPDPARQLFWSQTGLVLDGAQSQQPTTQLQQLGDEIIKACAGLPLALELTGAQLCGVTATSQWQVMPSGCVTPWTATAEGMVPWPSDRVHRQHTLQGDSGRPPSLHWVFGGCFNGIWDEPACQAVLALSSGNKAHSVAVTALCAVHSTY